jgi:hypothetical protein
MQLAETTTTTVRQQVPRGKHLQKYTEEPLCPGDQILLKRGGTFSGKMHPLGSGTSGNVIKIADYGTGNKPKITPLSSDSFAIRLRDQQYWEISNVEISGPGKGVGSLVAGILIDAGITNKTYNYFRITNCDIHDIVKPAAVGADSWMAGISFNIKAVSGTAIKDVIIDGCNISYIGGWRGIVFLGYVPSLTSENIIVRNCTVHHTDGDGIMIGCAKNIVIENNVAYETGLATTGVGCPTPNGIWQWYTYNCLVQNNESYTAHSFGVDGGGFDIDYYNDKSTVQYNYAHDNDGYGIAIFGADQMALGGATAVTDSAVVRYNISSYNGREAGSSGAGQGDIYTLTWANGYLNGLQIYNNTIYWSPNTAGSYGAAFQSQSTSFSGSSPKFFKNNIIYSTVPNMVSTSHSHVALDYNLYYSTTGNYSWTYNGSTYSNFSSYKSGSGQDANSICGQDPLLNSPTYHSAGRPTTQFTLQSGSPAINNGTTIADNGGKDFWGNTLYYGNPDIGAHELQSGSGCTNVGISAHPQNISVAQGSNATFTVTASGTSPTYQWQESTNGGSTYANISGATSSSYTKTSTTTAMTGYKYRCYVSNSCPSNVTSNAATLTVTSGGTWTRVNNNDASVTYSGFTYAADKANWYNTDCHYSNVNGHTATFTFSGTGVRFISNKKANAGIAKVYIDNVLQQTIDNYSSTELFQQVTYEKTGLSSGSHTLKIEVTNTKNASATDYYISPDAFESYQ